MPPPRVYRIDNVRPSITVFSPIDLPITNKESFNFTITFSENISTDTFTTEDFTVTPTGLVSMTDIAFDGTTATITATTNIPATQTGNLIITLNAEYEDIVGNEATENTQLYAIDVELPTVTNVDYTTTETDNQYDLTYTFSEEVVGITVSNFEVTGGTIADDIIHDSETVMLTVTSTEDTIAIRAKDFEDINKNTGNETIAHTLELGELTVVSSDLTIGNSDIESSGDNSIFTLRFTADVLAASVSKDDFIITAPGNITLLNITPSTGIVKEVTVEFKFTDANNTAKDEITIAAGSIRNEVQTNDKAIVIAIDREPRILGLTGGQFFNKEQLGNNSEFSYTFTFSEAINGLDENDFIITPSSDVSIQPASFSDGVRSNSYFYRCRKYRRYFLNLSSK